MAAAVHPREPDTAWFVPAVKDERRIPVDATGNRLAMGSTTGGLWKSEDQRDSWRCVSSRLPPIYAVRIAHPAT